MSGFQLQGYLLVQYDCWSVAIMSAFQAGRRIKVKGPEVVCQSLFLLLRCFPGSPTHHFLLKSQCLEFRHSHTILQCRLRNLDFIAGLIVIPSKIRVLWLRKKREVSIDWANCNLPHKLKLMINMCSYPQIFAYNFLDT